MAERIVRPAAELRGEVRVPGDKSIAHRALMLGALADGVSELGGVPRGGDVTSTGSVLRALGVAIEEVPTTGARTPAEDRPGIPQSTSLRIHGVGLRGLRGPGEPLDCGNSGTTMRLMAGVLAGQAFDTVLTGDASLRRRPMQRIVEPLTALGASVRADADGCAPLEITGSMPLRGCTHRPPVASAQVKSCILLAGLFADGPSAVVEQLPTRDHTERLLSSMGAEVRSGEVPSGDVEANAVTVRPAGRLTPLSGDVPGDVSSAAFWAAAAVLVPGSEIRMTRVGANPRRDRFLEVLRSWGADIERTSGGEVWGEPVDDVRVRGTPERLSGGDIGPDAVPGLIDELPLLAALGPFTCDGVRIRGAAELRVKESDRIEAIATALRRLGAGVDEFPDGLAVAGASGLHGGVVDAVGDHRIAMACGVVALAASDTVTVRGAAAADVSYPGFFDLLDTMAER